MEFKNGAEMYSAIESCDLYNEDKELYVFLYNDAGAVCVYDITKEMAAGLRQKSNEANEYWGAFLGVGGRIYDNPMDFCDDHYGGIWKWV